MNDPLKRGMYKMGDSRAAGGLLILAKMVRVELLWVGVEPGQGKMLVDAKPATYLGSRWKSIPLKRMLSFLFRVMLVSGMV